MPANRSSSGAGLSTVERASSKSSVGHTRCWRSIGVENHRPVGSIWVACAISARSRMPKYSPHGTRVVTRWEMSLAGSHVDSISA